MRSIKELSLIPGFQPEKHEPQANGTAAEHQTAQGGEPVRVEDGGLPHDAAQPKPKAAAAAAAAAAKHGDNSIVPSEPPHPGFAILWRNQHWDVSADGVWSRFCYSSGIPAAFSFEAHRLLQQDEDRPGVARWAVYLAGKEHLPDIELWLEAYQKALQIHHPDQTVIDMEATAAAAREAWARPHRTRSPRRPDTNRADVATASVIDWVEAEPEQYRELLRKYGAHPDERAAAQHNAELKALQDSGYTGAELETRAQVLEDGHFIDREAEEDDIPWQVEDEAENSREK